MSAERISIHIMDDGKFNVKFNMPDIQNKDEREDYLRHIGGIVVQVFSKKMLPGIADSFAGVDADGKFLATFVNLCVELKKIQDKDRGKYDDSPDAPLIRPSQVFQHRGDE